ncbi:hypothetical protein ACFVAJ_16655 [Agromyces sp. NPDC057679]|uniref:hypothetical protein n=1 Tax=Agromyces sp. NPDC057679 TaxID=3346207 RepID=UPI00367015CB
MDWLYFLAGLAVIPAGFVVFAAVLWLADKNFSSECTRCGETFGEIGKTYAIMTKARSRAHKCPVKRANAELG